MASDRKSLLSPEFGTLFCLMALWMAPWEWLLEKEWLSKLAAPIQFPWRLLGVSALLLSITAAIGIVRCEELSVKWNWLFPGICLLLLVSTGYYFQSVVESTEKVTDKIKIDEWDLADNLYLYNSEDDIYKKYDYYKRKTARIKSSHEAEAVYTNYARQGLKITVEVETAETIDDSVRLSFPLYYYPGYAVKIDGTETPAFREEALVSCMVPPGKHYVEVFYAGFLWFRICDIVSIISLIILLLNSFLLQKQK